MSRRRCPAVAIALLLVALAAAGCGIGEGEGVGEVELTVTRDFGVEPVAGPFVDAIDESDTVMRVLDRNAEIATRYGGGFVQGIDGLEATRRGARSWDWFFFVNGVESAVGAADYPLRAGEAIWWDYRDWSAAMRVPAVVGAWPQPFVDGYEGRRRPVAVECRGGGLACERVGRRLRRLGACGRDLCRYPAKKSTAGVNRGASRGSLRVLVGPWTRLRADPAAAQLEAGPQTSGVFADFLGTGAATRLLGLDEGGEPARRFGPDAGLVAATRRFDAAPTWVVTGTTARGVRAAAALLSAGALRDHYAVATEGGEETPLPIQ